MEQRLNNRTTHSDFWKEFNHTIDIKLDDVVREIHICYERRSNLIALIDSYKDYCADKNIDISGIYKWNSLIRIELNRRRYDEIEPLILSYIRGYNYLTHGKIPALNKRIKTLSKIRNIPFTIYTAIQEEYNIEACNYILKGNRFKLGKYLGAINLKVFAKKTNTGVRKINWTETNKLKEELLADGETLKSKDNPKGKHYIIYFTDDKYALIRWDKRQSQIEHRKSYKFRPIVNTNYSINKLKLNSIDDIFNDHGLGMYEKLSALRIHYPNSVNSLMVDD